MARDGRRINGTALAAGIATSVSLVLFAVAVSATVWTWFHEYPSFLYVVLGALLPRIPRARAHSDRSCDARFPSGGSAVWQETVGAGRRYQSRPAWSMKSRGERLPRLVGVWLSTSPDCRQPCHFPHAAVVPQWVGAIVMQGHSRLSRR